MTDPTPARPVPRWLHAWAILAVAGTFVLLLLGQMVTSFRAGMADPVWPTEPWYLAENYKLDFGYLIEHSHRIVGFTVGGVVSVLALGIWCQGGAARWLGLVGLVVLLGGYGEFHRGLMAQRDVPPAEVTVPMRSVGVIGAGLGLALLAGLAGLVVRSRGAGLRVLALAALVGVMVQGLLGGFRVKLNELVGTDLAAVHGVFAQVVFAVLVSLAVLTGRAGAGGVRPRGGVVWGAVGLAGLLFVQIVWGAMVRHDPTPLAQRLHFLTAFAATAAAVWVLLVVFTDPAVRARAGWVAWAIVGLFVAQLYLGVEAWMAKFGAYTLPELVPITREDAEIRTLHALVGSCLWASAVALAVRLGRPAAGVDQPREAAGAERWQEIPGRPDPSLETAGGFGEKTR